MDQYHFQNAFWDSLVQRVCDELKDHYKDRLVTVYVRGSVHRREAMTPPPISSDLDLVVFVADAFTEDDKQWRIKANDALNEQIPGMPWSTIPFAYPVSMVSELPNTGQREELLNQALVAQLQGANLDSPMRSILRNRASYYQFRYDATLVFGRDLISDIHAPAPGRLWARAQFQQPWDLVRHAAGLQPATATQYTEANITEWPLPDSASLKLRKLARLAVLSAGHMSMACGEFKSFRGIDVLPFIKERYPEWTPFLEQTNNCYITPIDANGQTVEEYLSSIVPWMDCVGASLARADH